MTGATQTTPTIATKPIISFVAPLNLSTNTTIVNIDPVSSYETFEEQVSSNTHSVKLLTAKFVEMIGSMNDFKGLVTSLKSNLSGSVSTLSSKINTNSESQRLMSDKLNEQVNAQNSYAKVIDQSSPT